MPMPSTFYCMETEFATSNNQLEADQRALQLAIEYSMLGLTSDDDNAPNSFDELRAKKSINMTECVQVPSSEHVAEIVGRQGCKIKALRAKTNTYIKTPVRGEEPVFVITGRKEDVFQAKREILSAAEHFSQIRAQRKNSTLNSGPSSPTGGPGQTTIQVRVPYRVVGLVVGPKGATIKRIQQATNTYIVTPSRDKEPIFEVTGSVENVESARKEIETHIALRTGALLDDDVFQNNGEAGVLGSSFVGGFQAAPIFASAAANSSSKPNLARDLHRALSTDSFYTAKQNKTAGGISDYHALTSPFSSSSTNGYFFGSDTTPSPTDELIITNHSNSNNGNAFNSCSPPPPASPSIWGTEAKNASNNVGSIGSGRPTTPSHVSARRLASEPLLPSLATTSSLAAGTFKAFPTSTTDPIIGNSGATVVVDSTTTTTSSVSYNGGAPRPVNGVIGSRSPTNVTDTTNNNHIENNNVPNAIKKKDCVICSNAEVVAAFVPCGHNFFCMECATRVKTENSCCPVCNQQVTQVLRIIS